MKKKIFLAQQEFKLHRITYEYMSDQISTLIPLTTKKLNDIGIEYPKTSAISSTSLPEPINHQIIELAISPIQHHSFEQLNTYQCPCRRLLHEYGHVHFASLPL